MTRVLVAWAAVNFFLALSTSLLWRRQGRPGQGAFIVAALSQGFYCIGSAWIGTATSPAEATSGMVLESLAGTVFFMAMTIAVHAMTGRPRLTETKMVLASGVVGLLATASGLFVDPAQIPIRETALLAQRQYQDAPIPPAQLSYIAFGVLFGSWVVFQIPSRKVPESRPLALALGLAIVGWLYDTALRTFQWPGTYLTEHLSSIACLIVSYLLMRRFVETANALAERTEELEFAYRELDQVQEELVHKEQLAAVGELSAVIAHEVRSPLSVLRNAVNGLRRSELPNEDRDALLGILDDETDRLNRLVRDLLAYARPMQLQARRVNIDTLVLDAVGSAVGTRLDVSLECNIPDDLGPTDGDEDLLRRAFGNIADNAVEAMPRGGTLRVSVSRAQHNGAPALSVRFADTGEGMNTQIRQRARDPFFTTRPSGTGLGLAIVERVARAHGGRISLSGGAGPGGQGTTVELVLPQSQGDEASP